MDEHFWSYVDKTPGQGPKGECWEWIAGRLKWGYGAFWADGKNWRAHRYAWMLKNGPIPEGGHILHSCDNPLCCNPSHLSLGDDRENARQRNERGRTATGNRTGARLYPELRLRGERSNLSKLTELKVIAIMARYLQGAKKVQIAREFGIGKGAVGMITNGKSWCYLFQTVVEDPSE